MVALRDTAPKGDMVIRILASYAIFGAREII